MLLKRLKSYWLWWKGRIYKSPIKKEENEDLISHTKQFILNIKSELSDVQKFRTHLKARIIVLQNNIGILYHVIENNDNKIDKLEKEGVLTESNEKLIEKYTQKGQNAKIEVEEKEEEKKKLTEQLDSIDKNINVLCVRIREYESSLREIIARMKTQKSLSDSRELAEKLDEMLKKIADLAKEIEQNQKK